MWFVLPFQKMIILSVSLLFSMLIFCFWINVCCFYEAESTTTWSSFIVSIYDLLSCILLCMQLLSICSQSFCLAMFTVCVVILTVIGVEWWDYRLVLTLSFRLFRLLQKCFLSIDIFFFFLKVAKACGMPKNYVSKPYAYIIEVLG